MWDQLIAIGLQLIIALVSFLIGKFLLPHLPKDTADAIKSKLELIATFATQYVHWAEKFMDGSNGAEKMAAVVGNLKEVAEKYGFQATDQQLTAIAQTAYEKMNLEVENTTNNIAAKAQEMAANMMNGATNTVNNVASTVSNAVNNVSDAVDKQTVEEANEALNAALSALSEAKQTIADLKAAAAGNTLGLITSAVESPKQAMQDKIAQLKEATISIMNPSTDVVEEPEYDEEEVEPEVEETEVEEEIDETPIAQVAQKVLQTKVNPETVANGMKSTTGATPTSLKELAASQLGQMGLDAVKAKADVIGGFLKKK